MAEEQIIRLTQKLQQTEAEYESYKSESKELEAFLEAEANNKQTEIRQLKEQAIKKDKQTSNLKNEISILRLEITSLKNQLSEKGQGNEDKVDKSQVQSVQKKLNEANEAIRFMESQNKDLQNKIRQILLRNEAITSDLKLQIKQKQLQIEDLAAKLEEQKRLKQSSRLNTDRSRDSKKSRTIQITIQKTKQVPILSNSFQETNGNQSSLKLILSRKEAQLEASQQKITKFIDKIKQYEIRIKELEYEVIQMHNNTRKSVQLKEMKRQSYTFYRNESSDEEEKNEKQFVSKTKISVLLVSKKHYVSPIIQIEDKNIIKLYKTDKNNRIEKALGSNKYRVSLISYRIEEIISKTFQNIQNDLKQRVRSRVIIYGAKRTNKKTILSELIIRLKKEIVGQIMSIHNQSIAMGIRYLEIQDDFVTNFDIAVSQKEDMINLLNKIQKSQQQSWQTPKKNERGQLANERKVRLFQYYFEDINIEIITTSYLDCQIKESDGFQKAMEKIAYSKVPEFNYSQKCNKHLILTVNPILAMYDSVRQTLRIVGCKRKKLQAHNVFEWRESPSKNARKQVRVQEQVNENQVEGNRLFKMNERVQFYKLKLNQLLVKLKVLINTKNQASYLKKSQTTLNYQKIVRFVQSIINISQDEFSSPIKRSAHISNLSLEDLFVNG